MKNNMTSMKTPYRLKHIPTGLYYTPKSSGAGSNLSIKGKIYGNDYMYNQLTDKHPEWEGSKYYNVNHYYDVELFGVTYAKSKKNSNDSKKVEVGLQIINGDIPVELKWNNSSISPEYKCIHLSFWSHPEDWEKEYVVPEIGDKREVIKQYLLDCTEIVANKEGWDKVAVASPQPGKNSWTHKELYDSIKNDTTLEGTNDNYIDDFIDFLKYKNSLNNK